MHSSVMLFMLKEHLGAICLYWSILERASQITWKTMEADVVTRMNTENEVY